MAERKVYRITKNSNDEWNVKKEGFLRTSGNFDTKKEAIQHRKDPYPPKG